MSIDLEELAAVIRLIRDAEFSEFVYSRGETSLQVRRGEITGASPLAAPAAAPVAATAAVVPVSPVAAPVAPAVRAAAPVAAEAVEGTKVLAPLLGTFYSTPKPGEAAFVKVGDRVEPETVLCIVEVMKLMNSVTAGVAGVIAAVHARDGDLVEHGQPLFTVAEAA